MLHTQHLIHRRKNPSDEYYTMYDDIEEELQYYKKHFRNKIVYCNCDDYRSSEFVKYFTYNFQELQLKELIVTGFVEQKDDECEQSPCVCIYSQEPSDLDSYYMTMKDIPSSDFRSKDCIELLKKSDIVVTNPPFSLFKELVPLLEEHKKKYILLGDLNKVTISSVVKLFMQDKIRCGIRGSRTMKFNTPNNDIVEIANVCWWTNVDYTRPSEKPYKQYTALYEDNKDKYEQFDNIKAMNVNALKDIPCDYDGVMGVPLTYVMYANPNQFKILGCKQIMPDNLKIERNYNTWRQFDKRGNEIARKGKPTQMVKGYKPTKAYAENDKGERVYCPYARVYIQRKK